MDIRHYIAETERSYPYRVKFCFEVDDAVLDVIERAIFKFQPFSMGRPKKTMFQSNPLDFVNVQNVEVWIVDMVLGLPVAPHILHAALRDALQVADKFIVVKGENDPHEIETKMMQANSEIEAEAEKAGLTRDALLKSEHYEEFESPDGSELYGTKANERLLNYIAKVEKERHEKSKVEPTTPLFKWMDLPDRDSQEPVQDASDFNDGIKDAPVLGDAKGETGKGKGSRFGNMDDEGRVYRRPFKDQNGKGKMLSRSTENARKDR